MCICDLNPKYPLGRGQSQVLMDRMKIIKKRLSMSLQSVRRLDESLSELPEHTGLDEPPLSRESGETKFFRNYQYKHTHTNSFKGNICTLTITQMHECS